MTPRTKTRLRVAAPAALIVLGAALLTGCVFIPAFNPTIRGTDVSEQVGAKKSRKPIRLHTATRDDVIRLLGQPHFTSPDKARIAYSWQVRNGTWVWPLCFMGYHQDGARMLLLTFDDAGVLRTYELLKRDASFLEPGPSTHGMLPYDMPPPWLLPQSRPALEAK